MGSNKTFEYHIVGSAEANPAEMKLSNESPGRQGDHGPQEGRRGRGSDAQGRQEVQDHGSQGRVDSARPWPHQAASRDRATRSRPSAPRPSSSSRARPTTRRTASARRPRHGRRIATWGSSSSSTSSTARAASSSSARPERTGELDLHLGDIVGVERLAGKVDAAASRRCRWTSFEVLARDPRAAPRHVPRHRRTSSCATASATSTC